MTREIARSRRAGLVALQVVVWGALTCAARAGIQQYHDDDRQQWFDDASAKGTISTIDFTGFSEGTFITNQYQNLGVTFLDGDDYATYVPGGFVNDDWGIDGNSATHLLFEQPQIAIALDHPGLSRITLYLAGIEVLESQFFGAAGLGHFGGITGVVFDEAVIVDPIDGFLFIDDIHIVAVPAPSTMVLMFSMFAFRSRRRSAPRMLVALVALQIVVAFGSTTPALAGAENYFDADQQDWFDDAAELGTIRTIDFTGYPEGTFVTDQYQYLGVTFAGGDDYITYVPGGFLNDDWGIDPNATAHLIFDTPQIGISTAHPGDTQLHLYLEGALIYESPAFGGTGLGHFGGVLGVEFDEVIITDPGDNAPFIDDIYFVGVPTPPTMVLMLSMLAFRSRRRTAR